MKGNIDWVAKKRYARTLTIEQLIFAMKDCRAAGQAMPEDSGYYCDEASVYSMELNNRRRV